MSPSRSRRRFFYIPTRYYDDDRRTIDTDCDISLVHEDFLCAKFVEQTLEDTFPWADVDKEDECDDDDDVCIVIPGGQDCEAYADDAVQLVEAACLGGGGLRGYTPDYRGYTYRTYTRKGSSR